MKLKIITRREDLDSCKDEWNRVAGSQAFSSWDWNVNWFRRMGGQHVQPFILAAVDESERWHAIAPFYIDGRRLRFFGGETACTDYTNLIAPPEKRRLFADSVAIYLATRVGLVDELSQIEVVEIEGGAKNDEDLNYFCDQMNALNFISHEIETEGTWRLALPKTPEELLGNLKSSCRRKVRKARKRLASEDTTIGFIGDSNADMLWQHFTQLHQKRRRHIGESGCFANSQFESFLKDAFIGLFNRDLATLFVIYKSKTPIASQLILVHDDHHMMYQSGVDPDYLSIEPGYQAIVVATDYAIHQGATIYDFLRGDEDYKSRWTTDREPIVHRRLIPKTFSARFKHNSWVAKQSAKRLAASILKNSSLKIPQFLANSV